MRSCEPEERSSQISHSRLTPSSSAPLRGQTCGPGGRRGPDSDCGRCGAAAYCIVGARRQGRWDICGEAWGGAYGGKTGCRVRRWRRNAAKSELRPELGWDARPGCTQGSPISCTPWRPPGEHGSCVLETQARWDAVNLDERAERSSQSPGVGSPQLLIPLHGDPPCARGRKQRCGAERGRPDRRETRR
ncbi:hypothetical protein C8Q79DRAFT_250111 [Trametes meyenii]|nr:hypothetical protein C8Q79DRAFT_250111 [Trametes meyenii]